MEQTKAPKARSRLSAAVPPLVLLVPGAFCWGIMMALSALLGTYLRNRLETDHTIELATVYFLGGLLAWPCALPIARFLAYRRPVETRFAAHFLALSVCTMAMTAFLFALDYRSFYARWHAPFGSVIWMFQFVFTSASAVYQFAVLGSPLFLPLGLVFLLAASLYLAKDPH